MLELLKDRRTSQPMKFLLVLFLFYFIPFLLDQILLAADIRYYNDDTLVLFWTYQLYDESLFKGDYIADYYRHSFTPPVYYALTAAWSKFFDPYIFQKYKALLLWLVCTIPVYIVSLRLGGKFNAIIITGIYLLSQIFMNRMVSGLAHGFAFPLLWSFLAAMLSGRTRWVAFIVILSAGLYPVITPLCGIAMALWMLFPKFSAAKSSCTHADWPVFRRLLFLAGTAIIAACLVLPIVLNLYSASDYGDTIDWVKDKEKFPELIIDAPMHLIISSRDPWLFFFFPYVFQFSGLAGDVVGFLMAVVCGLVIVTGILVKRLHDPRLIKLRPFAIAAVFWVVVYYLFRQHELYRQIIYPFTVLVLLLLPMVLRKMVQNLGRRGIQSACIMVVLGGYLLFLGHTNPDASGYFFKMDEETLEVVNGAAGLPKDAVFAGWPYHYQNTAPTDLIPYFSQRQSLYLDRTSAMVHSGYALEMRRRMMAIAEAYSAQDSQPFTDLRDKFGVNYFILNRQEIESEKPPKAGEPYQSRIAKRWKENTGRKAYMQWLISTHSVFANSKWYIVDLKGL